MLSMALAGVGWFSLFDSGVSGERCHSYNVYSTLGVWQPCLVGVGIIGENGGVCRVDTFSVLLREGRGFDAIIRTIFDRPLERVYRLIFQVVLSSISS